MSCKFKQDFLRIPGTKGRKKPVDFGVPYFVSFEVTAPIMTGWNRNQYLPLDRIDKGTLRPRVSSYVAADAACTSPSGMIALYVVFPLGLGGAATDTVT